MTEHSPNNDFSFFDAYMASLNDEQRERQQEAGMQAIRQAYENHGERIQKDLAATGSAEIPVQIPLLFAQPAKSIATLITLIGTTWR